MGINTEKKYRPTLNTNTKKKRLRAKTFAIEQLEK